MANLKLVTQVHQLSTHFYHADPSIHRHLHVLKMRRKPIHHQLMFVKLFSTLRHELEIGLC